MGLPRAVRDLSLSGERSDRQRRGTSDCMKNKLAWVFDELLQEIAANPDLRARIERHLSPPHEKDEPRGPKSKPKNRRGSPALDPYAEIKQGEQHLRQKLTLLSIDQ